MNMDAGHFPRPLGQDWLDQMFRAKSAMTGGVLRRSAIDVDREIGRAALELEVRRRGFHMLECGAHFVVVCSAQPLKIIC